MPSTGIDKGKVFFFPSPAEAEEGQVEAQQCGDNMSDKGTSLAGVQVEPKPAGREQGKELAGHKVHLRKTEINRVRVRASRFPFSCQRQTSRKKVK